VNRVIFVLVSMMIGLSTLSGTALSAENTNFQDTVAVVGKPAPNFKLEDYKGSEHSLSDYKGKFVVLEWVNFVCPFSRKHYESGNMPLLQKEYVKKGVVWLSINSSAPGKQGNFPAEKIKEEIKAYRATPTAYLVDSDGHVGHLYSAKTTPSMYIINPEGILVYRGAIDDKPTPDKDDIPEAKNYVKAALEEAMSNKPIAISQTKSYGCSVKYAE
jgi:glutathione peroxidase-family protein